jgi:hypothetical protein
MSNSYEISEEIEGEIRARDKKCVYCRVSMKKPTRVKVAAEATIEHFNNDGPFTKKYNLAICCRGCNSSKGVKTLLAWFKTPHCAKWGINEKTVAKPVKNFMRAAQGARSRRGRRPGANPRVRGTRATKA